MTNFNGASFEDRTTQLLEKNAEELANLKQDIKKIKSYILWGKILNLFYLIIIVAPVIFAIIYLPKIIQNFTQNYLNNVNPGSVTAPQNFNDILKDYKNIIK
jgi:hypothetical protein